MVDDIMVVSPTSEGDGQSPEHKRPKRTLDLEENAKRKTIRQTWYVEMQYNFDKWVKRNIAMEKTQFSIKEVSDMMNEMMYIGRDVDDVDRPFIGLQESIEDLKEAVLECNPSYAAKVKLRKKLGNKNFDPLHTTKNQVTDIAKYQFSVKLYVSDNRTINEKAGREILLKTIQPMKNRIRMTCWQSRHSGNMVLDFPTPEERDNAKALLNPSHHKVLEKRDKKVSLWIKFAQHLENQPPDNIAEMLTTLNPDLLPEVNGFESKWIGKDDRKRLKLIVPARIACRIIATGFLYTEGVRHPVQVMPPLPFRCGKCLTFHNCKGENCSKDIACRYCGAKHTSDSCPIKNDVERHHCTTCQHYQWKNGARVDTKPHEAMSKDCPSWKAEAQEQEEKVRTLLREAMVSDKSLS